MIGKNIKRIRESLNMGVNETARKIGMSSGYLSALERGEKKNPSTKTLEKIADAFEVPLDYLTRKSAKAIIEDRLEELGMSVETLSEKSKVPVKFINNLDDIIPFEGDYERLKPIANVLGMDSKILINALYRHEPPAYDGPVTSVEKDFNLIDDVCLSADKIQLLSDFDKLNTTGKLKARERVHELSMVPTYTKIHEDLEIEIFAAHNDNISDEVNSRNIEKIKAKYKKMHDK